MYAIVDIQGQQFKVEKDAKVYVHRLEGEEGAKVSFDKVLLLDNNGTVTVGAPTVSGAQVSATILSHLKDKKVIVFKRREEKAIRSRTATVSTSRRCRSMASQPDIFQSITFQ